MVITMVREKLPRGYGGVIKMKGRRSKPYMVRITTGYTINEFTEKAYATHKIIGYAKSRKDGILMLQEYHENPHQEENNLTFRDIYRAMSNEFLTDRSISTYRAYNASYQSCPTLHQMKFTQIRVKDLQEAIDKCGKNYPTLRKIKVMFNMMYKYAMKYDIVSKDYSTYVDIVKHKAHSKPSKDKMPFTKLQIDKIWLQEEDKYYQIILMLVYTGVRISELLQLKKEDIHLEEQYFDVIKSKTENGIRKVPIADCILPFFKNWYNYSKIEYLLCTPEQEELKYRNYKDSYWDQALENIGIKDLTPHCTRHTCISLLAEAKVDPTTIKKIVGHRGAMTLTEKVYTHLDVQVLVDAVNEMYLPKNKR
jgi:integrase